MYRLKVAHLCGQYKNPFGFFQNNSNRYSQITSFRVHVGDLSNREHTHHFNDLFRSVFTVMQINSDAFYQDEMDFECEYYLLKQDKCSE